MLRACLLSLTMLFGGTACQTPPAEAPAPPPFPGADTARVAQRIGEGIISTALPEFATTFSPEDRTIYFNRTPADRSVLQLWSATYAEGQWQASALLPFSDGSYRDIDPFLSPDGRRLYFSSTRPLDGTAPKDFDLWYAERTPTGWNAPVNVGATVNTAQDEIFATLTRTGHPPSLPMKAF